jgi:Uma2 family endonuclease
LTKVAEKKHGGGSDSTEQGTLRYNRYHTLIAEEKLSMAAPTAKLPQSESKKERTPPLEAGDRLTVKQFEHRYAAMWRVNKAELIDGVVYMPSPVTHKDHGSPHFDVVTWAGVYRIFTPGVDGGDNSTLRLEVGENQPQPDAFLRVLQAHGGQSRLSEDGYVVAAPEWIGEIAASSANYDLHAKLEAYQKNRVREYVVWQVRDEAIDWFVLRNDRFERLPAGPDGVFRSEVLPGLWLDPAAMIRRDMMRVFQVVQQGIQSPEHAEFVSRLQSHATQK